MKLLSRTEEMMLLAVWRLGDNAYGVSIRDRLEEKTGRRWAFGALFVTLDRLVRKGYLESHLSDPTPRRGGRSKRMYRVTRDGIDALREIKRVEETMWKGIGLLSPKDAK